MNKLIIMVGLPGSGKSTIAKTLSALNGARIFESDWYRETYFNNDYSKETNVEMFKVIHNDILDCLEYQSCIFDSTGLSYKHRIQLIERVRAKYGSKIRIIAHIVATEYTICVSRDSLRPYPVGEGYIKRARESFHIPMYTEGFDEINISLTYDRNNYIYRDLEKRMMGFDQETIHHTLSLYEHSSGVFENVLHGDAVLWYAAILHDVGKMYTKTFKDSRGNPSEYAHYYGHEFVSAYEALFYLDAFGLSWHTQKDFILDVIAVINYHMRPYSIQSERAKQKLIGLVGEKIFEMLMEFNKADRMAK